MSAWHGPLLSGSFMPYVPLQITPSFLNYGEDRVGQVWGDASRQLLVTDSTLVAATGSFWSHSTVDLLTQAPSRYTEHKLTTRFKRLA